MFFAQNKRCNMKTKKVLIVTGDLHICESVYALLIANSSVPPSNIHDYYPTKTPEDSRIRLNPNPISYNNESLFRSAELKNFSITEEDQRAIKEIIATEGINFCFIDNRCSREIDALPIESFRFQAGYSVDDAEIINIIKERLQMTASKENLQTKVLHP